MADDKELETPYELLSAYAGGLTGYRPDARLRNQFLEGQRYQAYEERNLAGSGRGKRSLLWPYAQALDKRCFTEKQSTGDCVSHGSRNARDISRAVGILVNREPYEWFQMGATEPTYGARGHSGQGMSPAAASIFERDVGFLSRSDHGIVNLTNYDASIGTRWGAGGVPSNVQELCRRNKVGRITPIKSQNDLMDAMANGYAAHSGQYAAWEVASNDKGIHPRATGGWNHDMAIVGVDDSMEFYPVRVWFIQNSWGRWNQQPKKWPVEYPPWVPGMIVTSQDDFQACIDGNDCWVYGSVEGYPPQKLPDFGSIGLLEQKD